MKAELEEHFGPFLAELKTLVEQRLQPLEEAIFALTTPASDDAAGAEKAAIATLTTDPGEPLSAGTGTPAPEAGQA